MKVLETDRLILRTWEDSDLQQLFVINQDPKVMEFFPKLQDMEITKTLIHRINTHFDEYGYTLYACVRKDTNEFIGFIGLFTARFESPFTPATEIGWRLSSKHWGHGFATEGAKKALESAFTKHNLPKVISFTSPMNIKSIRVMEKLGMHHGPNDVFDHPDIPDDSPIKPHVLYHLTREQYFSNKG